MGSKQTIILADDSKIFQMYFSTLLGRMNFEVMPVSTGEDALHLARITSPNLLALDVRMAGLSGIETLKQARDDKQLANIPVVMISGNSSYAEECFASGCTDFLTKPVNLDHLHIALQKCQQKREGMRKHLRAPFNRTIKYIYNGKQFDSHAINLSEGGLFLRTAKPLPLGSRLDVDIPLGKKESMLLCGEVIYTMDRSRGELTLPPGMAIRFDACEAGISQRLSQEVKDLLAGDILEG